MPLTRRLLLLGLIALPPGPARAGCLIGACDLDAVALIEAETGQPLPADTRVVGALEGGFQDRFVQIRLEMTPDGLIALADGLGARTPGDPRDFQLEIQAAPWWDLTDRHDIRIAEAKFGHFAFAFLAYGPAASGQAMDVYLLAFET